MTRKIEIVGTVEIIEAGDAWSVVGLAALTGAIHEMGTYAALRAEYLIDGRPARLMLAVQTADDQYTYNAGEFRDAVTGQPLGVTVSWDEERR